MIKLIGTPRRTYNDYRESDIKEIWEDCTGFVEFSTRCGLKLSVREIISYWNKFEENKK